MHARMISNRDLGHREPIPWGRNSWDRFGPVPLGHGDASTEIAFKAAWSALVQRRQGSRDSARALYRAAHSLLRALRVHLRGFRPAA